MLSAAGETGSASIFPMPPLERSSCVTSTQQTTRLAGIMNHTMPINPWIK